jgi:hypothetical protein
MEASRSEAGTFKGENVLRDDVVRINVRYVVVNVFLFHLLITTPLSTATVAPSTVVPIHRLLHLAKHYEFRTPC